MSNSILCYIAIVVDDRGQTLAVVLSPHTVAKILALSSMHSSNRAVMFLVCDQVALTFNLTDFL